MIFIHNNYCILVLGCRSSVLLSDLWVEAGRISTGVVLKKKMLSIIYTGDYFFSLQTLCRADFFFYNWPWKRSKFWCIFFQNQQQLLLSIVIVSTKDLSKLSGTTQKNFNMWMAEVILVVMQPWVLQKLSTTI